MYVVRTTYRKGNESACRLDFSFQIICCVRLSKINGNTGAVLFFCRKLHERCLDQLIIRTDAKFQKNSLLSLPSLQKALPSFSSPASFSSSSSQGYRSSQHPAPHCMTIHLPSTSHILSCSKPAFSKCSSPLDITMK